MTSRISQRMVQQQEFYELFHDYWNLFTALNTYVAVLRHSSKLDGVEKKASDEITQLLPRLEEKMEAIRARMMSHT